jgi:hypothetical protein
MRQQSRQPDEWPVGQIKRATLVKYLFKKGELENSSRFDLQKAEGSLPDESTMDKKGHCLL